MVRTTLGMLLALGMAGLSSSCCVGKKVHGGSIRSTKSIRAEILSATPVGTTPSAVIDFMVNDLCPSRHRSADPTLVEEKPYDWLASKGVLQEEACSHLVRCNVGKVYQGLFTTLETNVSWTFDRDKRLKDVSVTRESDVDMW